MKTLVIDDEEANRNFLHIILKSFGPCDLVASGQEAIDAFTIAHLDNEPYDLVCLDIMMPEMDGQKVLKHLRELEQTWKLSMKQASTIIMVSALDTEQSVLEAFYQGGCTAYVAKPFTKGAFLKKLHSLRLIPKQ